MRSFVILLAVVVFALTGASSVHADILVAVDKSAQQMTVSRNGQFLYRWPVSTGRGGYATPSGSFTTFRMEAEHFSVEWDDAPMPHSIFFTKIGHAIHGSNDIKNIGRPASHGCVRLAPENAATLFELVRQEGLLKTKVVLTGSEKIALARTGPALPQKREAAQDRWPPAQQERRSQERWPQAYDVPPYPRTDYSPRYDSRYDPGPDYFQRQYGQPQYGPPGYRY